MRRTEPVTRPGSPGARPSRRGVLQAAAGMVLASALPPAAVAGEGREGNAQAGTAHSGKAVTGKAVSGNAVSARFREPGGVGLDLAFWDEANFRLVPTSGPTETWIVSERIFLVLLPSLATAGATRILWLGNLAAPPANVDRAQADVRPTSLPEAERAAWALGVPVHDATVTGAGRPGPAATLSVARLPHLARAQHAVERRLRAAMDMNVCGDGIERLTRWWAPAWTGQGFAAVATSDGPRLDGPVRVTDDAPPPLPADVIVEDYRISRPG